MAGTLIPTVIGFLLFAAFVGYLALKVMAAPLLVIIGLALVLCLIDFVRWSRE